MTQLLPVREICSATSLMPFHYRTSKLPLQRQGLMCFISNMNLNILGKLQLKLSAFNSLHFKWRDLSMRLTLLLTLKGQFYYLFSIISLLCTVRCFESRKKDRLLLPRKNGTNRKGKWEGREIWELSEPFYELSEKDHPVPLYLGSSSFWSWVNMHRISENDFYWAHVHIHFLPIIQINIILLIQWNH